MWREQLISEGVMTEKEANEQWNDFNEH